jgi:hypothetical protein
MSMVPNRPTPEGRLLGKELARLADKAEAESVRRFPGTRVRCGTCAFRSGTAPNGCLPTVMDAFKCVMEHVPFMCHESLNNSDLCMGWLDSQDMVTGDPLPTPWDFSFSPERSEG